MTTAAANTAIPAQLCQARIPNSGRSASGTDAPSFMKMLPTTVQAIIRAKARTMRMLLFRYDLPPSSICNRLGADRRPRHLIDPVEFDVGEPGLAEQRFDGRARPIMRDLGQHLIEHDRADMRKGEPAEQFEITDPPHPKPQGDPQRHRRIQ